MILRVHAKELIGSERSPCEDGRRLAERIVADGIADEVTEIDVRGLTPEDLVSSFVNELLHGLEGAGIDVDRFRSVVWVTEYPSEARTLRKLTELYLDCPRVSERTNLDLAVDVSLGAEERRAALRRYLDVLTGDWDLYGTGPLRVAMPPEDRRILLASEWGSEIEINIERILNFFD